MLLSLFIALLLLLLLPFLVLALPFGCLAPLGLPLLLPPLLLPPLHLLPLLVLPLHIFSLLLLPLSLPPLCFITLNITSLFVLPLNLPPLLLLPVSLTTRLFSPLSLLSLPLFSSNRLPPFSLLPLFPGLPGQPLGASLGLASQPLGIGTLHDLFDLTRSATSSSLLLLLGLCHFGPLLGLGLLLGTYAGLPLDLASEPLLALQVHAGGLFALSTLTFGTKDAFRSPNTRSRCAAQAGVAGQLGALRGELVLLADSFGGPCALLLCLLGGELPSNVLGAQLGLVELNWGFGTRLESQSMLQMEGGTTHRNVETWPTANVR